MLSESEGSGNWFTAFMASTGGRIARAALGAAIIGTGLFIVGGVAGVVVAAFGLVPIATGVLNLCPVAPAWGGPFNGASYCQARRPRSPQSGHGDTP
ncbi:MAG: DUF2892 domain-containing protein [Dehalococcoidia bacterium]|nr:DUF2892 domain-containing protein [Dehalococcoidia bacterium]